MCYQDTIQVAVQKTRRARMERVRAEAKAKPDQLLEVREFLHPQIDEITDTLPTLLGRDPAPVKDLPARSSTRRPTRG